jgi:hypothetical protein
VAPVPAKADENRFSRIYAPTTHASSGMTEFLEAARAQIARGMTI